MKQRGPHPWIFIVHLCYLNVLDEANMYTCSFTPANTQYQYTSSVSNPQHLPSLPYLHMVHQRLTTCYTYIFTYVHICWHLTAKPKNVPVIRKSFLTFSTMPSRMLLEKPWTTSAGPIATPSLPHSISCSGLPSYISALLGPHFSTRFLFGPL